MLKKTFSKLFPHICVVCQSDNCFDMDLCVRCLECLQFTTPGCKSCGCAISKATIHCEHCANNKNPIDELICPFLYKGVARGLVKALKLHKNIAAAQVMAILMKNSVYASLQQVDYVIAVPNHYVDFVKRGFNQSTLLAHALADNHKFLPNAVSKNKFTRKQGFLNREMRKKNLKNAYVCKKMFVGKKVAIVDDVITTSSTLRSIGNEIKSCGAQKIFGWVFSLA